jgi:hypothetical protein
LFGVPFLVVFVCLFACMLGPDACVTLEGARSKSFEDLEFQEQELKRTRVEDSEQLFSKWKASVSLIILLF